MRVTFEVNGQLSFRIDSGNIEIIGQWLAETIVRMGPFSMSDFIQLKIYAERRGDGTLDWPNGTTAIDAYSSDDMTPQELTSQILFTLAKSSIDKGGCQELSDYLEVWANNS